MREGLADAGRRNIYFSALAVPGHVAMASSKALLLLASFSAFMAANVLFTLGLAAVKVLVVISHRRARDGSVTAKRRAYRSAGAVVTGLSTVYVVSCLPLALGHDRSESYDQIVAIAVATIAFCELGFSVHGFFSSRKRNDPLMEAVKLTNLASSLILLVLAQTAILSFTSAGDASRYNGWCGVGLGTLSACIGIYMLVRPPVTDLPARK